MSFPCKFCGSPSSIHLTDIIHKKKREMHICEACAREKNIIPDSPKELNVPALLELVLGVGAVPVKTEPGDVNCPDCGIHYAHFRNQGRLGCPNDYAVFRELLEPLLERVHNDATRHQGKIPRRHQRRLRMARRAELEAQLRSAILAERYETAAKLRDDIRALEADHEP
jgi:protein arginine kinase activator